MELIVQVRVVAPVGVFEAVQEEESVAEADTLWVKVLLVPVAEVEALMEPVERVGVKLAEGENDGEVLRVWV